MPLETHIKRTNIALLGVFIFFSFIELVQTGVLVGSYNRNNDYPSGSIRDRTRFLLFTSLWTIIFSIVYLVGFFQARLNFLFSIASHTVWMALTWLFWLAGAAAITAALGGGLDCGALPEDFGHCNQLNSAEAFAWINWIIATIFLGFLVFIGARSARSGNGFAAPVV